MQNIHTNSNLQETTKHGGPDFPLEFYIDDTRKFYNNDINWHWHKEFELNVILEGEGDLRSSAFQRVLLPARLSRKPILYIPEKEFLSTAVCCIISQLKTMASCLILYFPPLFLLQVKVLFTKNIFCH